MKNVKMDRSQFSPNEFIVTYQNKEEQENIVKGFDRVEQANKFANGGNKIDQVGGEYKVY